MLKNEQQSALNSDVTREVHDRTIASGISWSALASFIILSPISFFLYAGESPVISHSKEILRLSYIALIIGSAFFVCGHSSRWRIKYWFTSSVFISLSFVGASWVVMLNWNSAGSAEKILIIGMLVILMSWYSNSKIALTTVLPIALMYGFLFINTPFYSEFDRVLTLTKFPIIFFGFMLTVRRFLRIAGDLYADKIHTIQRLEKESTIDELTRTSNRRGFNEGLRGAILAANRFDLPLSLAIVDIDFFKQYNDELGHPAGDLCLKKVAAIISSECRRSVDIVARTGGEEFALILPATTSSQAILMVEKIRRKIEEVEIKHPASITSQFVTISCGIAEFNNDTEDELYEKADRAMYQAKMEGRNRSFLLQE